MTAVLAIVCDPAATRADERVSLIVRAMAAAPGATPRGESVAGANVQFDCGLQQAQATTDRDGFAALSGADCGRCRVIVRKQGYGTWEFRFRPHRDVVTLTADLRPMGIDILVLPEDAARPRSLSVGTRQADFERWPGGNDPWSLLETSEPAAILDRIDGPGLSLGRPGRFSMRGASWTQNAILLDGLDITDRLRGGTPLAYPDRHALEAIDVTSALAPVEHGAPGVTLALRSREPRDSEWRAAAQAYWAPAYLQADASGAVAPAIARLRSLAEGSAQIDSAQLNERWRFNLAGRASRSEIYEKGEPATVGARVASLFGAVAYRPSPNDQLRFTLSGHGVRRPFAGRARYFGDGAFERVSAFGAQGRWAHEDRRASLSLAIGHQTGSFHPQTYAREAGRPADRLIDGPVPDLIAPDDSRRATWTARGTIAPRERRWLGLWHAPRIGATFTRASSTESSSQVGLTPETVDGLPARVWDYGFTSAVSRRHLTDLALYAADRIARRDRLLIELGLRAERASGSAEGAAQNVSWNHILPRASARLKLTDFGHLTVFGGYGAYRQRLLLDLLAYGDPSGAQGSVYRWLDHNGDGLFTGDERGALIAHVGPGAADGVVAAIDPQLRPAATREWVIGLESFVARGWIARLTGFDRRERNPVAPVNIGVPATSYAVRLIPDPSGDILGAQDDQLLPVYDRDPRTFGQDRYLLTNVPDESVRHQSVELRVEKILSPRWSLRAGATAMRSEIQGGNRGFRVTENDSGVLGELFENPNAATWAKGRGFFDRAFTIKVAASYRAPENVLLGIIARYQDGQPFNRFVIVRDLAQGPEAIPATPRGQIARASALDADGRYVVPSGHRFEYLTTVDARIEKTLRWHGKRLALSLEAFNLLDLRHEIEEYVVWNERFRAPTLTQPPRMIRLGARLEF
ncbi:MAG: TonB-dependent receptor [Vicinamibacteria bacterium]|jgi:hypothetical protein|nr:TonB-dependent receptor [Vicinamibacteria bacterium]